ncbi:hypothetical protein BJ988_002305 [Nocardioides panzhihuensis]|uniref:Uncharacterized protein n=1 Tax=Nocardioides panzhihuensis TaxID=860243 RepID=A0A7Z0DLJ4_9ACTN|nr:hypothetical protein [Nocardioides panzhihuensis]
MGRQMAAWLLILVGAAALVVVVDPNNAPGVQAAAHGHAERTNIQHNSGTSAPASDS